MRTRRLHIDRLSHFAWRRHGKRFGQSFLDWVSLAWSLVKHGAAFVAMTGFVVGHLVLLVCAPVFELCRLGVNTWRDRRDEATIIASLPDYSPAQRSRLADGLAWRLSITPHSAVHRRMQAALNDFVDKRDE